MPDDEEWIDTFEAAAILGVTRSSVSGRIHSGHLPSIKRNGRRYLRRTDVQVAANVKAFEAWVRASGGIVRQH